MDALFAKFEVTETIHIIVPAERVWDLITDVERIVEFSPECIKVEWLNGATAPAVGARFAGMSRIGAFEWTRNCTIIVYDEPTVFAYEVFDEADELPQSRWRFEIAPDATGTTLTQHFSHVPSGRSTIRQLAEANPAEAEQTIAERAEMLAPAMRHTLEAMRRSLEG
jgi:uncharacterized protein YndB with AHSA1/START domain